MDIEEPQGFTLQEACGFAMQVISKGIMLYSISPLDNDGKFWEVRFCARLHDDIDRLYTGSRLPFSLKKLKVIADDLGVSVLDLFVASGA